MKLLRHCLTSFCLFSAFLSALTPVHAQTFRNPQRIATELDPNSILVADLNGDGHLDMLYGVLSTRTVHTLLWSSAGYQPGQTVSLPSNGRVNCGTADMDGDGRVDLLCPAVSYDSTANRYQSSLLFYKGMGDGTFAAAVPSAVTQTTASQYPLAYPVVSTIADVTRDGMPDVLMVDPQAGLSYMMINQGSGAFVMGGLGNGSDQIATLFDMNGDGLPDLVSPNGPYVQLSKGDGTFGNNLFTAPLYSGCTYRDLDGDGKTDAACSYSYSGGSGLYILRGNGDGTLNSSSPVVAASYLDGPTGMASLGTVRQILDWDGDGKLDVFGTSNDGFTTLRGMGGLRFGTPHPVTAGYPPTTFPAFQVADLNGDGLPDLVALGPSELLLSLSGAPTRLTPPEPSVVTQPGYTVGYAALADFNGDGIPDVVATSSRDLTLATGKGDGTFTAPVTVATTGSGFQSATSSMVPLLSGDFNGDGKQDIVVARPADLSGPRDVYLLTGHGDGTFSSPALTSGILLPTNFDDFYSGANRPVADINHDGRDDVLTHPGDATKPPVLQISLSNGDGTFRMVSTPMPYEMAGIYYASTTFPVLADFDGDGNPDVVFATAAHAYIMRGLGNGSFDTASVVSLSIPSAVDLVTPGTMSVTTGDFDGDGHRDIAILSTLQQSQGNVPGLHIWYGKGDRTFGTPITHTLTRQYYDLLAADLDHDGKDDLVLKSEVNLSSSLALILGQADRSLSSESHYVAGQGLSSLFVRDLNGDGLPDILVANGATNQPANTVTVLMNLENALSVGGTVSADPEPSQPQQSFDIIAALVPADNTVLSGKVTFSLDGAAVGTAPLANNTARVTHTGALAIGKHALIATWPGDGIHTGVTLAGSHVVTGPSANGTSDFTFTASGTTVTAYTVDDVAFNVTATRIGTFNDTLNLSVSGQQSGLSATASPTSISLSAASSGSASIKIHTGYFLQTQNRLPFGHGAVLAALAGLPFSLLLAARRRRPGAWLLLMLAFVLCGTVTGCSLPPTDIGLKPGVYHLHVTATGAQTSVTHGVDVTLNVVPFP